MATGAGIWATHFVAMLAFKTGLPTIYDPILTLALLRIAMGVTAIGFLIAVQGDRASKLFRELPSGPAPPSCIKQRLSCGEFNGRGRQTDGRQTRASARRCQ